MLIFIKAFIYIFYQFFKFQLSLISKTKKKIKEIESIKKHLISEEKTKGKNKKNILLISFVHQPGYIYTDCLIVSSLNGTGVKPAIASKVIQAISPPSEETFSFRNEVLSTP